MYCSRHSWICYVNITVVLFKHTLNTYLRLFYSINILQVALPNLKTLLVSHCNGLRSLMTLSMAESMVNLTTMQIENCDKLEEIIKEQVEGEKVKEDLMIFSQLQDLKLANLPRLTRFCLRKLYTLEFSSLERVYVRACPNMKTFSEGDLVTPKLRKVTTPNYHPSCLSHEEYCWEGNLNSTIQKMFKEMVCVSCPCMHLHAAC